VEKYMNKDLDVMYLGSHVSFNEKQLVGCIEQSILYGANTFMFYSGAPQNTIRRKIDLDLLEDAKKMMKDYQFNSEKIICHAPYIINLANKKDLEKWQFYCDFLRKEIERCEMLGISNLVLHPGTATGMEKIEAIANIIEGLNKVLENNTTVRILLETMAGKGSEVGSNIEELKQIYDGINKKENIMFCLDTCHLNDSGIDLSAFSTYLEQFEQVFGLSKIGCIHINDSKNEIGAKKDRHANFGMGTIGFETLMNIILDKRLRDVPFILETPYVKEFESDKKRIYPPYKFELEMIKNYHFNPNFLEDIRNYYKKS